MYDDAASAKAAVLSSAADCVRDSFPIAGGVWDAFRSIMAAKGLEARRACLNALPQDQRTAINAGLGYHAERLIDYNQHSEWRLGVGDGISERYIVAREHRAPVVACAALACYLRPAKDGTMRRADGCVSADDVVNELAGARLLIGRTAGAIESEEVRKILRCAGGSGVSIPAMISVWESTFHLLPAPLLEWLPGYWPRRNKQRGDTVDFLDNKLFSMLVPRALAAWLPHAVAWATDSEIFVSNKHARLRDQSNGDLVGVVSYTCVRSGKARVPGSEAASSGGAPGAGAASGLSGGAGGADAPSDSPAAAAEEDDDDGEEGTGAKAGDLHSLLLGGGGKRQGPPPEWAVGCPFRVTVEVPLCDEDACGYAIVRRQGEHSAACRRGWGERCMAFHPLLDPVILRLCMDGLSPSELRQKLAGYVRVELRPKWAAAMEKIIERGIFEPPAFRGLEGLRIEFDPSFGPRPPRGGTSMAGGGAPGGLSPLDACVSVSMCICNNPSAEGSWVACSGGSTCSCGCWFHLECIGMTMADITFREGETGEGFHHSWIPGMAGDAAGRVRLSTSSESVGAAALASSGGGGDTQPPLQQSTFHSQLAFAIAHWRRGVLPPPPHVTASPGGESPPVAQQPATSPLLSRSLAALAAAAGAPLPFQKMADAPIFADSSASVRAAGQVRQQWLLANRCGRPSQANCLPADTAAVAAHTPRPPALRPHLALLCPCPQIDPEAEAQAWDLELCEIEKAARLREGISASNAEAQAIVAELDAIRKKIVENPAHPASAMDVARTADISVLLYSPLRVLRRLVVVARLVGTVPFPLSEADAWRHDRAMDALQDAAWSLVLPSSWDCSGRPAPAFAAIYMVSTKLTVGQALTVGQCLDAHDYRSRVPGKDGAPFVLSLPTIVGLHNLYKAARGAVEAGQSDATLMGVRYVGLSANKAGPAHRAKNQGTNGGSDVTVPLNLRTNSGCYQPFGPTPLARGFLSILPVAAPRTMGTEANAGSRLAQAEALFGALTACQAAHTASGCLSPHGNGARLMEPTPARAGQPAMGALLDTYIEEEAQQRGGMAAMATAVLDSSVHPWLRAFLARAGDILTAAGHPGSLSGGKHSLLELVAAVRGQPSAGGFMLDATGSELDKVGAAGGAPAEAASGATASGRADGAGRSDEPAADSAVLVTLAAAAAEAEAAAAAAGPSTDGAGEDGGSGAGGAGAMPAPPAGLFGLGRGARARRVKAVFEPKVEAETRRPAASLASLAQPSSPEGPLTLLAGLLSGQLSGPPPAPGGSAPGGSRSASPVPPRAPQAGTSGAGSSSSGAAAQQPISASTLLQRGLMDKQRLQELLEAAAPLRLSDARVLLTAVALPARGSKGCFLLTTPRLRSLTDTYRRFQRADMRVAQHFTALLKGPLARALGWAVHTDIAAAVASGLLTRLNALILSPDQLFLLQSHTSVWRALRVLDDTFGTSAFSQLKLFIIGGAHAPVGVFVPYAVFSALTADGADTKTDNLVWAFQKLEAEGYPPPIVTMADADAASLAAFARHNALRWAGPAHAKAGVVGAKSGAALAAELDGVLSSIVGAKPIPKAAQAAANAYLDAAGPRKQPLAPSAAKAADKPADAEAASRLFAPWFLKHYPGIVRAVAQRLRDDLATASAAFSAASTATQQRAAMDPLRCYERVVSASGLAGEFFSRFVNIFYLWCHFHAKKAMRTNNTQKRWATEEEWRDEVQPRIDELFYFTSIPEFWAHWQQLQVDWADSYPGLLEYLANVWMGPDVVPLWGGPWRADIARLGRDTSNDCEQTFRTTKQVHLKQHREINPVDVQGHLTGLPHVPHTRYSSLSFSVRMTVEDVTSGDQPRPKRQYQVEIYNSLDAILKAEAARPGSVIICVDKEVGVYLIARFRRLRAAGLAAFLGRRGPLHVAEDADDEEGSASASAGGSAGGSSWTPFTPPPPGYNAVYVHHYSSVCGCKRRPCACLLAACAHWMYTLGKPLDLPDYELAAALRPPTKQEGLVGRGGAAPEAAGVPEGEAAPAQAADQLAASLSALTLTATAVATAASDLGELAAAGAATEFTSEALLRRVADSADKFVTGVRELQAGRQRAAHGKHRLPPSARSASEVSARLSASPQLEDSAAGAAILLLQRPVTAAPAAAVAAGANSTTSTFTIGLPVAGPLVARTLTAHRSSGLGERASSSQGAGAGAGGSFEFSDEEGEAEEDDSMGGAASSSRLFGAGSSAAGAVQLRAAGAAAKGTGVRPPSAQIPASAATQGSAGATARAYAGTAASAAAVQPGGKGKAAAGGAGAGGLAGSGTARAGGSRAGKRVREAEPDPDDSLGSIKEELEKDLVAALQQVARSKGKRVARIQQQIEGVAEDCVRNANAWQANLAHELLYEIDDDTYDDLYGRLAALHNAQPGR